MGILRDRMIEEMKLRNFSPATQESYVYAVSRLAKYHKKSPDLLSKEDIRAFLVHLTVERKLSPNSLTGYCSGLRFFYNETLGWDENKLFIPPRKKPSVLPEVFSPDEVVRLIGAARGLKQRVFTDDRLFGRTQSPGVSQSQDRRHRCGAHDPSCEAR
jgi:integrase/recombinase XerD